MDFFTAMEILASGLTAERVRMNVTASNLANANTTRTAQGGPYRRQDPVFESTKPVTAEAFKDKLENELQRDVLRGVTVMDVINDNQPPRQVYNPSHPDANQDGYVAMPNIQMVEEMVNMITASRSYEAGVTAMRAIIDMAERALSVGR